jgi:hypothetical protein
LLAAAPNDQVQFKSQSFVTLVQLAVEGRAAPNVVPLGQRRVFAGFEHGANCRREGGWLVAFDKPTSSDAVEHFGHDGMLTTAGARSIDTSHFLDGPFKDRLGTLLR